MAMKTTGIVRRIDELGRIVLPIELRRNLHIGQRDALEIHVEGDKIILRKCEQACVFCSSKNSLHVFRDKPVCASCWTEMSQTSLPESSSASTKATTNPGASPRQTASN
jgi:transcriptional pleiotropic regulator of transition state genes